MIGISEMEVALMVHDVVPNNTYLTPLDSFHTFDLDGGGDISWAEFKVDRKLDGRPLLEVCFYTIFVGDDLGSLHVYASKSSEKLHVVIQNNSHLQAV